LRPARVFREGAENHARGGRAPNFGFQIQFTGGPAALEFIEGKDAHILAIAV
jgi:hypothetical protein